MFPATKVMFRKRRDANVNYRELSRARFLQSRRITAVQFRAELRGANLTNYRLSYERVAQLEFLANVGGFLVAR